MLLESIYLKDDLNVLNEGLGDFVKKLASNKNATENFIKKIKACKKPEEFTKLTTMVPKFDIKKINTIAKEKIDGFDNKKKLVAKKLNKDIPVKYKDPLSSIIALSGKDDKSLNKMIHTVNMQDWANVTHEFIFSVFFSIGLAGGFAIGVPLMVGAPVSVPYFTALLSVMLVIDIIVYMYSLKRLEKKLS